MVEDNNLSLGARLMFVRILDLSVRQASNVRPGVVTISQQKLADKFAVSDRTIWNWRSELIRGNYVWMSKQWMPNAWAIDTYHVTPIHPKANTGDKTTVEGLWGNGTRRGEPVRGMGARQPGQQQIPGTGAHRKGLRLAKSFTVPVKDSILPDISTADRSQLRLSTEKSCGSQPKQASVLHRKDFRLATEKSFGSPPKQASVGNRKILRFPTEAGCEHKKATGEGSSHLEGGRTSPAPPDGDQAAAFRGWERRLDDMRNSDLRRAEEIAGREFQAARGEAARSLAKRKLAAIRLRLRGPVVADAPAPGPVKSALPKPPRMTPEQSRAFMAKAKAAAGLPV